MTYEEFDALVGRLQVSAKENPTVYKLRVFLWAVMGYACIGAVLLTTFALMALCVAILLREHGGKAGAIKGLIALLAFTGVILRALWIKLEAPSGIAINRKDFSELFGAIDEVRKGVRAPRAHQVLLTDDFNAAVSQVPRLGVFGWQKNHLILGLPLLESLTPDQAKAVLAHEFGHLSKAHGRFGTWIYRVQASWCRLTKALEEDEHWGRKHFRRFLNWYFPRLDAYSFVNRRKQEYEADRSAAKLFGGRVMADALINVRLRGRFFRESYWPAIYAKADSEPKPIDPYTRLLPTLRSVGKCENDHQWLEQELAVDTNSEDSHPSLRDRLGAIGEAPRVPDPIETSACEAWLGPKRSAVLGRLDEAWREEVSESWKERYEKVQGDRARLCELSNRAEQAPLSMEDEFDRIELIENLEGGHVALPQYKEFLRTYPKHISAIHSIGLILLGAGDESGIPFVEEVIELWPEGTERCCTQIYNFLMERNREEEARTYYDRVMHFRAEQEEFDREREDTEPDATYLPHELTVEDLEPMLEKLREYPEIRKAYLVRKQVQTRPESPCFVLGYIHGFEAGSEESLALVNNVAEHVPCPDGTMKILGISGTLAESEHGCLFTEVENSEIY